MDLLGIDLGEIAGTFLGQGNWRPQRKAMVRCWEAVGWPKPQGDEDDNLPADGCPDGPVR